MNVYEYNSAKSPAGHTKQKKRHSHKHHIETISFLVNHTERSKQMLNIYARIKTIYYQNHKAHLL